MQLSDFLTAYAPALTNEILRQFAPLYTPTVNARAALDIPDCKRRLFAAQQDTVMAVAAAFRQHRAVGIAGEPGFGKTFTTLALARFMGCRRVLVLCPPHLVEEWREEVERCLAHCPAYIIETITDLEKALVVSQRTSAPMQVWILAHSRAKLRYAWEPAVWRKPWRVEGQRVEQLRCPHCGQELLDDAGAALGLSDFRTAQQHCPQCQSALWQPIRTSRRLMPLASYIKHKHPGVFDLLVADECHEYKAASSAQALAFHKLMRACRRTLALTGTLSSGKASDVFPLLYRLSPEVRARYSHDETVAFVRDYGILEQVTYHDEHTRPNAESDEDGAGSIRKGEGRTVYERPGLSPALVPLLLNRFVFLRLADIAHALPPYEEIVHPVALPADVATAYQKLERQAIQWATQHKGSGLAQFLQALLAYPDQPWAGETLTAVASDGQGNRGRVQVARAPAFDPERRYPKEEALIEILTRERARGRKVLVFAIHTDTRDLLPRLTSVAAEAGVQLVALRAGGEARHRKRELRRLLTAGADGIVCHPRLVQTGLNLTDFPTIVFYQFDYSTYTLRQASRRSYRPSQTQPVEVHFLCYRETVQEKGLALMARKLRSALMAEGEFVDDGLSAFGEDNDITRELTRSLLHGHAVPGLEATFQALTMRPDGTESRGYLGEPQRTSAPGDITGGDTDDGVALVRPLVEASNDAQQRQQAQAQQRSEEIAWQRLEALRAAKQAAQARRAARRTVQQTLAGNPGQLSLFDVMPSTSTSH